MPKTQPWSLKDATMLIRQIVTDDNMGLSFTVHVSERMAERSLIMSDLLFAIKNGFATQVGKESKIAGYYKYCLESKTPNSENRYIRIVLIPDLAGAQIKLVTVMWVDEKDTRSGTIVGEEE